MMIIRWSILIGAIIVGFFINRQTTLLLNKGPNLTSLADSTAAARDLCRLSGDAQRMMTQHRDDFYSDENQQRITHWVERFEGLQEKYGESVIGQTPDPNIKPRPVPGNGRFA